MKHLWLNVKMATTLNLVSYKNLSNLDIKLIECYLTVDTPDNEKSSEDPVLETNKVYIWTRT